MTESSSICHLIYTDPEWRKFMCSVCWSSICICPL